MATEEDLASQVLAELHLLDANDTPSAEDQLAIITRYHQRLLQLADDDYADWMAAASTSDDGIPDVAMPGLIRVMAWECAAMFQISKIRLVDPDGLTWENKGLALLRRYMRKKPSYEPVRADYF
jgi:hypothetical protein